MPIFFDGSFSPNKQRCALSLMGPKFCPPMGSNNSHNATIPSRDLWIMVVNWSLSDELNEPPGINKVSTTLKLLIAFVTFSFVCSGNESS